ncbi:MAG: T9SS type A sorting domain-containing protein [Bacteroidales bacterium]|nr:T9SS type A sorting domain-containing protein [Bacteroidales bacterium]
MKQFYSKNQTIIWILLFPILFSISTIPQTSRKTNASTSDNNSIKLFKVDTAGQCTIGVATGKATSDSRPMIWKTTDGGSYKSGIHFDDNFKYGYMGEVTYGDTVNAWFGLNDQGFAIANSWAMDLMGRPYGGLNNGSLMRFALGTCATVDEFQALLDSTNKKRSTAANYAVLDASGAAKIFEVNSSEYWSYDANDSTLAPNGYLVRTNFSEAGGGLANHPPEEGYERYMRSHDLLSEFHSVDSLSYKNILRTQMRDFSGPDIKKVTIPVEKSSFYPDCPLGYYLPGVSICNFGSVSSVVIQGVLPEENPLLSIMWTIMGQPASSIVVPYWMLGDLPDEIEPLGKASPFSELSWKIRQELFDPFFVTVFQRKYDFIDTYKLLDGQGGGLWTLTFPLEDTIIKRAEEKIAEWRSNGLNVREVINFNKELASFAYDELENIYEEMFISTSSHNINDERSRSTELLCYPNPTTGIISFDKLNEPADIQVYSAQGQLVLSQSCIHNQIDLSPLPSAIYYIQIIQNNEITHRQQIVKY